MRSRLLVLTAAAAVLLVAAAPAGLAQAPSDAAAAAVARIARLIKLNDNEGALVEAMAASSRFPVAIELRCQRIKLMEWNRLHDAAVMAVDSLVRAYPEDPGVQRTFALAVARQEGRENEALAAAMKARRQSPWDPENLVVTSLALQRAPSHGPAEAVALMDSALDRGIRTPALLERQARLLLAVRDSAAPGGARIPRARDAAREALRLDSMHIPAYVVLATALEQLADRAGAHAALQRAAELAPLSIGVHERYWYSVLNVKSATTEQKRSEILPDLERLLNERPDFPSVLYYAASVYLELGLRAAYDSIALRLVREYPGSYEGQRMLLERVSALHGDSNRAQKVRLLRQFIDRPVPPAKDMLQVAHPMLFALLLADSTTPTSDLVDAAGKMMGDGGDRYNVAYLGAIALADRGEALVVAERLAASIMGLWSAFWAANHAYGIYNPEREAQSKLDALVWMHDALGWVHFRQGKIAEAQADLERALEINPKRPATLAHAGQVAERQGRQREAERLYVRGYMAERFTGTYPNEALLRRMYERSRKSAKGLDEFVASLQELDRAERRDSVLATRAVKPRRMPAFRLANLKGDTVASADLAGRVLVVNFWGTWCAPCIKELPYLQEVHRRYAGDARVAFLTIDHGDPDVEQVRRFVAAHRLDLPVLLDQGLADRGGVVAYPTTWFVARNGLIAFETQTSRGPESIVEEFTWRIEELLGEAPPTIP